MNLAEASGLADKPIHGEGLGGGGGPTAFNPGFNLRHCYNGWSSYGTLKKHNLAYDWSNPMKISLTEKVSGKFVFKCELCVVVFIYGNIYYNLSTQAGSTIKWK